MSPLLKFWYRVYPELRYLKTREQRRAAKRAFRKRGVSAWKTTLAAIVIGAGAGVCSYAVLFGFRKLGLSLIWGSILNTFIWAILGGVIGVYIWRRPYIRFLRRYLQEQGVPVCLKCGYDLRGLTEPRCPECGEAFDAELLNQAGLEEPVDDA